LSRYALSKAIALMVGVFCLLVAYNSNKNQPHSIQGLAYGTSWSVTSDKFIADHHEKNIIKIIDRIDYVASNYKEDSEIALVNFNNNSKDITISSDLYEILTIAKEVEIKSDGYYDITLGKLSSARGFSPSFNASLEASDNNDYKLTNINTLSKSSSFWFDLSSIAKGYAVQKIHDYLMENNIKNHLIDIGGEVIVNGFIKSNQWKIGIQHPKSSLDTSLRVIENLDGKFLAIATSGEYR
jgi:thiamine biosynthesis lipoprotein